MSNFERRLTEAFGRSEDPLRDPISSDIIRRKRSGQSLRQIANELGMPEYEVEYIAKEYYRSLSNEIKRLYHDERMPVKEISNILNIKSREVYDIMNRYNIEKLSRNKHDHEKIVELFKTGRTAREIADELGLDYTYVSNALAHRLGTSSHREKSSKEEKPEKDFWQFIHRRLKERDENS